MNTTTQPIIKTLEDSVSSIHGWSPIDQLYSLFLLAFASADMPGNIIEIGSWAGRSALALGEAVRLTNAKRTVYCIDLFPSKSDWYQNKDGTYSFKTTIANQTFGGYQQQTVWKEPFETQTSQVYLKHDSVLNVFMENMTSNKLDGIVQAFRGDSTLFFASQPADFLCHMAFLDGDHGYNSVCCDIRNVDKHLVPGGWICFDDAFTTYDGVNRAINEMIVNNPRYELQQQMTRKFFIARRKTLNRNNDCSNSKSLA